MSAQQDKLLKEAASALYLHKVHGFPLPTGMSRDISLGYELDAETKAFLDHKAHEKEAKDHAEYQQEEAIITAAAEALEIEKAVEIALENATRIRVDPTDDFFNKICHWDSDYPVAPEAVEKADKEFLIKFEAGKALARSTHGATASYYETSAVSDGDQESAAFTHDKLTEHATAGTSAVSDNTLGSAALKNDKPLDDVASSSAARDYTKEGPAALIYGPLSDYLNAEEIEHRTALLDETAQSSFGEPYLQIAFQSYYDTDKDLMDLDELGALMGEQVKKDAEAKGKSKLPKPRQMGTRAQGTHKGDKTGETLTWADGTITKCDYNAEMAYLQTEEGSKALAKAATITKAPTIEPVSEVKIVFSSTGSARLGLSYLKGDERLESIAQDSVSIVVRGPGKVSQLVSGALKGKSIRFRME